MGICVSAILILMRVLGALGLYLFIGVATISANIQVLKTAHFWGFDDPIALGTIVFSCTYLTTDILNEYYGPKAAQKGVWFGFFSMILMTLFMVITLTFKNAGTPEIQQAMEVLFHPTPALLISSLVAYFISQYNDIWIFSFIRKLTNNRHLWLRTTLSTVVSAFIDNVIFSVLAFMVFAPTPKQWSTVLVSYILGTYGFRVLGALISTPVIYLARYTKPK